MPIPANPENSRYQMNCIDCVLVQNGSFYLKEWNTHCFRHHYFAFVIVLLGESWMLFLWLNHLEPVFLFLHIGEPSIATSKMSLQWSVVGKLHHSNCNVWCGDINDVCYVLSVTVCVHWFCQCIVTKSVQNLLFKIIGEYVKFYHTSKCLWLNFFESTVVQNGAFLKRWELLYWSFMHSWICKLLLHHSVNPVHISSVVSSPWIRNVSLVHTVM